MKKYIIRIVSVVLFMTTATLFAQNVDFDKDNFPGQKDQLKESKKNLKEAFRFLEIEPKDYFAALPYFLKANDFNPSNADLNYQIALCYIKSSQEVKSIKYLEKAIDIDPSIYEDMYLYLAKSYQLNNEFDKAVKTFKMSLSRNPSYRRSDVEKHLTECSVAKELMKKPVRAFIDNLGEKINSKYPEYSPCISADESMMIFTSRREGGTGDGYYNDPNGLGDFPEDIYITYHENGEWTVPINPGKPLNTDGHDASVALAPDGQRLMIFKGSENGGDVEECLLKGSEWQKPHGFGKPISSKFFEPSASYSYDGKTLYFVSDREGGIGEKDIYKCTLGEKDKWTEAENLGGVINTKYEEDAIFMHPDGKTLYFSSKGHKTMGGYDIFKSVFEDGKWSTPENLGFPINTSGNDVFLTVSASGRHGYMSSARVGGFGDQDIYMITFLGPEMELVLNTEDNLLAGVSEPISDEVIQKEVASTSNLTILKGSVLDEESKDPLLAKIVLTDNEANMVVAIFESNSATGKYLVSLPSGKNYGIAVKAEGYLFHSENVDIKLSTTYQEINKDILLKKIDVGKKIVLKNIFFDYAKATLRPESKSELDNLIKLLIDNPGLKIEISGHTDSRGTDVLNQKLSENRAKSVVNYLVEHQISASKLTYVGYGEKQPIASNETDEGRQLNRRTEFKILSK